MIMKKNLILFAGLALFGLFAGCSHVISKETLNEIDKQITFAELRKDSSLYRGKIVLLGGVIVKALNEKDGTILEIYQTRLDSGGKPMDLDRSKGRFLALYRGFLDNEIYRNGRRVTIAGIVEGERNMKLGKIDYSYPYLTVKEIHLWKDVSDNYYPYHWDPWGPYWYDPYWDRYPYRSRPR